MINDIIEKLANANENPCVTISLETHRTFPDCDKDPIKLKNLFKEAQERLVNEFGKRGTLGIVEKMDRIAETYDFRHSMDSLHIFLSDSINEVVKSPWPIDVSKVHISDYFAIKPLIIMRDRVADYLVLVLSKGGAKLYVANDDKITREIEEGVFPSTENPYFVTTGSVQGASSKRDSMMQEYFNRIDKEVVKISRDLGLKCLVVTTEENYTDLLNVADVPKIYIGYSAINYNDDSTHTIGKSAWTVIQSIQRDERTKAIEEMQEAVGQGRVITDLKEIYRAAKEGRGELLIVHNNYLQPALKNDEGSFDLIEDVTTHGAIDDINSVIAKEVISKKGRVVFTNQDEIKTLGKVALKTRF